MRGMAGEVRLREGHGGSVRRLFPVLAALGAVKRPYVRAGALAALPLLFVLTCRAALAAPPADPAPPRKSALSESVKVSLVQLEVTVWPKNADSDACLGLGIDDFELSVDGKPAPIYSVDSMGVDQELLPPGAPASASDAASRGLSLVILFDLYHLDLFYRAFSECPMTKVRAFAEVRRLVKEEFHTGDRLLLVTAMGWPIVHYGWIRDREEALRAIDRLEKDRYVVAPQQTHSNHLGWIAGMESLFLALGKYPGRKDVIYLADDFRFDDVAMRMYEIAAQAQANSVVVNAVDLLESCRKVPGPPCPTGGGGLGCTEFRYPVALGPLSTDTGGELFLTDRIAPAIRELRAARRCRYVVSFRRETRKSKRAPSVDLRLKADRRDVTLLAPSSFLTPDRAPTQQDKDNALFLLPLFGRGIAAQAALWPYKYDAKSKRWKTFVLVRVERTDEEPWPEELHELTVDVLLHRASETLVDYRKKIAGADLDQLRGTKGTKLMLFPVEGVRPGETTVDLTVTGGTEDVSAKVRKSFGIPKPPKPGEANPWFLSDHQVRFGESVVLAPSLDDAITPNEVASFIGYGCRSGKPAQGPYAGRLVPLSGGAPVPVPIAWMEPAHGPSDACGWLLGRVESPLPPGLWTFEPPKELSHAGEGSAGVEFSVISDAPPSNALPAELLPKPSGSK